MKYFDDLKVSGKIYSADEEVATISWVCGCVHELEKAVFCGDSSLKCELEGQICAVCTAFENYVKSNDEALELESKEREKTDSELDKKIEAEILRATNEENILCTKINEINESFSVHEGCKANPHGVTLQQSFDECSIINIGFEDGCKVFKIEAEDYNRNGNDYVFEVSPEVIKICSGNAGVYFFDGCVRFTSVISGVAGNNPDELVIKSQLDNEVSILNSKITEGITTASHVKLQPVTVLPTGNDIESNIIYLVPYGKEYYEEFIWIDNRWEKIGDTKVDLTPYYTASQIDEKVSNVEDDITSEAKRASEEESRIRSEFENADNALKLELEKLIKDEEIRAKNEESRIEALISGEVKTLNTSIDGLGCVIFTEQARSIARDEEQGKYIADLQDDVDNLLENKASKSDVNSLSLRIDNIEEVVNTHVTKDELKTSLDTYLTKELAENVYAKACVINEIKFCVSNLESKICGFASKDYVDEAIDGIIDNANDYTDKAIDNVIENYYTKAEINTKVEHNHYEVTNLNSITGMKEGDTAIVKTVIKEGNTEDSIIYSHTAYIYDEGSWKALDGNYCADNVYFSSNIQATKAVGTITIPSSGSTEFAIQGLSVSQVLQKLLAQESYPTVIQPSATISLINYGAYEVGTSVKPEWKTTFDAGKYSYQSSTGVTSTVASVSNSSVTIAAGALNGKTGTSASIIVEDSTSYKPVLTYGYTAGTTPLTNLGNDATVDISGATGEKASVISAATGKTATSSKAISGYRKTFWGTLTQNVTSSDITASVIRGLKSSTSSYKEGSNFNITVNSGDRSVIFAYPATLPDVGTVLDDRDSNSNIVGSFTENAFTLSVPGASTGTEIDYKVFFTNYYGSEGASSNNILKVTI